MLFIAARVLLCFVLLMAVAACGAPPQSETPSSPPSEDVTSSGEPSEGEEPDTVPVAARDLIRSVVRVELWLGDEYQTHGSGTVISDDGLILTNAHVATASDVNFDRLIVAVTEESDEAPVARYEASVMASDSKLDLALIRADQALDGGGYDGALRPLPIASADSIDIGDELLIIGYPAIGLDTVTVTSGQVSGFTGDPDLGNRAWIKTDATISGGNSGGAAINAAGELVGVPTQAAAGEIGSAEDIVDCRAVRDTNGDGEINRNDDCVPLGGFLNGVRPTELASDMIAAVESGVAYHPIGDLPEPEPEDPDPAPDNFVVANVDFSRPFMTDVSPDEATPEDLVWIESATQLCAWWEYSGMADGVTYDAIWAYEDEVLAEVSYLGEVWTGGESGDTWVCFSGDEPLTEGVYDFSLNVDGQYITGTFVGLGAGLEPVDVTIENAGASDSICYLYISPDTSGYWGADWLGAEEIIEPGNSITYGLPPNTYDMRGTDCSGEVLFEERFDIAADYVVTYQ